MKSAVESMRYYADILREQNAIDSRNSVVTGLYDKLNDAYYQGGEEALAKAMGISTQQLDHEINEIGYNLGKHADDDREEILAEIMDEWADQQASSLASFRRQ